MHYGEILRARRLELRLSQEEVGARLRNLGPGRASQAKVSRLERGIADLGNASWLEQKAIISVFELEGAALDKFLRLANISIPQREELGTSLQRLEPVSGGYLAIPVHPLGGDSGGAPIVHIHIPEHWPGEHEGYQLQDDSMEPFIPNGAYLAVRKQSVAEEGNIVIAESPGSLVCREVASKTNGRYMLGAHNPRYRPIEVNTIIGVVVKFERVFNG